MCGWKDKLKKALEDLYAVLRNFAIFFSYEIIGGHWRVPSKEVMLPNVYFRLFCQQRANWMEGETLKAGIPVTGCFISPK